MPEARRKTLKALAGALIAAALVVAPLVTAGASATTTLKGVVGQMQTWKPQTNQVDYWQKLYAEHDAKCYKYDASQRSDHGKVTDGGKTVTLNAYQNSWPGDHWELLVIKGGSLYNNVIEHPTAGVAYASPLNKGGQQSDVSHWIVCKGTTPEQPQTPNPTQDLDCVAITVDYGRALTNGDHINITYDKAKSKQVNASVDLNVAGGWNGLGLRYSDGTTKPLTKAQVTAGKISWAYSALIPDASYTVSFVQTNQTDTWPNLECGVTQEPEVVTPTLTYTPGTCQAEGTLTLSQNADWTSAPGEDGVTVWTAAPKDGTVFAAEATISWPVPALAKLSADADDCRPAPPAPTVKTTEKTTVDCKATKAVVVTTTTTTEAVWDVETHAWVPGTPTSVDTTAERALTADEMQTCPPVTTVETGEWTDGVWACGDTTVEQTRTVTTTVGDAEPTVTTETQERDLTQAEIGTCPLVPGDIDAICVGDVPYLGYGLTLPAGFVADSETPVTITFLNPDGENYVVTDQPLNGELLWPGASDGEPKMWPGWELVDGEYAQTDGNFAWTRQGVTVRFDVNPTYSTEVEYPEASAECANPPIGGPETPTTPTEDTPTDGTPAKGTPATPAVAASGDLATTGGGVSPIVVAAGGATLAAGIAVVAIAAYRRRRAAAE